MFELCPFASACHVNIDVQIIMGDICNYLGITQILFDRANFVTKCK